MKHIAALSILLSIALVVHAQEIATVRALIEKGGKKLTKEQLTTLFANGATVTGIVAQNPRRKFYNTFNKDGSLAGRSTDIMGQNSYGLLGTWSINDEGQFCTPRVSVASSGNDATPKPPCTFYFVLDSSY